MTLGRYGDILVREIVKNIGGRAMLLSFKTPLIPNNNQETAFRKAPGVGGHGYNWANGQIMEVLELRKTDKTVKIPWAIDLHKN
ncbi:hypothetical protein [Umezakia ovalisporum]